MATPMEWFMAVRFLRDGRMQSLLIIIGVGVGVAVTVFLSALINGLQANLIAQTLGSQAHIVVRAPDEVARPQLEDTPDTTVLARVDNPPQRMRSILGWQQQLETIARTPGVIASAPIASGAAFASRGGASRAVLVRGSDLARLIGIIPLDRKLVAGAMPVQGPDALIGVKLAADLGLDVGDKLRLTTAEGVSEVYAVRGIFDLGNKDVNARWVVLPLRGAQTLLGLEGGVTELDLSVDAVFTASDIAARIQRDTGLVADSWMEVNAQLLTGLRSQSSSSLMIQVFVILAVAMGIASVLVVSVIQRPTRDRDSACDGHLARPRAAHLPHPGWHRRRARRGDRLGHWWRPRAPVREALGQPRRHAAVPLAARPGVVRRHGRHGDRDRPRLGLPASAARGAPRSRGGDPQ